MKGFCKDNERRIGWNEDTGVICMDDIIGAKVQVISLSMSTALEWSYPKSKVFTIEDVKFRVQTDGKCHTLLYLEECPGRVFTIKDIVFV